MARQTICRDFTFEVPQNRPAGALAKEIAQLVGYPCDIFADHVANGKRLVSYSLEIEPGPKINSERIEGICRAVRGIAEAWDWASVNGR